MKRLLTNVFASAAIMIPFGVSQSLAGDASTLNVLGFTSDGTIFAFEEFGTQDGSGFPYANRFYIDTTTDGFIGGSPIRIRIDDETATVGQARVQAKEAAQTIVDDAALQPAFTAGFNPITETSADPYRMAVNPRLVVPPIDKQIEFRLSEKQFTAAEQCSSFQEITVGFELTMVGLENGQTAKTLHSDSRVPASRNCPLGYQLGGVHTFFPAGAPPVYAITVAIRSMGFEGPDHRWLAVTTRDE